MAYKRTTRARYGDGTVYEKRPGQFTAQIRVDGRRVSATGRSADEARAALAGKVAGTAPTPVGTTRLLTGDYLAGWLEERRGTMRESSHVRYGFAVRKHLAPLGAIPLAALERQHVVDLLSGLRAGKGGRPLSGTTVRKAFDVLAMSLRDAVARGLLSTSPAARVPRPRADTKPRVILSAEQMQALLGAAQGHRHEELFLLAATTGMREGELFGLRWGDIDWEGHRLTVTDGKTDAARRVVPLSVPVLYALSRRKARLGGRADQLVFGTRDGLRLRNQNFLPKWWRPLLAKAGLAPMPFHDLRHSAITYLLSAGEHPHAVSEMVGHANVGITLGMYGHLTREMRSSLATTGARLIGNQIGSQATESEAS